MKIYYKNPEDINISKGEFIPFTGLVSIDIGYRTCGITIVNTTKKIKTINFEPIKKKINLLKLGIPDYYCLSSEISKKLVNMINRNKVFQNYAWSMEIPNIMGSYTTALSILLCSIAKDLEVSGVKTLFFTHNRLGGFYLKKRSYNKSEILKLVKDIFDIDYKITDHEADSMLASYTILKGIYGINLKGKQLRDFKLELQRLDYGLSY